MVKKRGAVIHSALCIDSGIPIPMKTQTAKQQPHAYEYTNYMHTMKMEHTKEYSHKAWASVAITLRFHLEFGDFLSMQSNFKKDAPLYIPSPSLRVAWQR